MRYRESWHDGSNQTKSEEAQSSDGLRYLQARQTFLPSFLCLATYLYTILTQIDHRLRRVKCDEDKPFCLKCTTTGRQCDGYTHYWNRGLVGYQSQSSDALGSYIMSFDIQGDEQERRSFSFFRSRTAFEIAGYFPSYFWETLILQASHADPAILHVVIALG